MLAVLSAFAATVIIIRRLRPLTKPNRAGRSEEE